MNSKLFGGVLSISQRALLYNTIVHESWHWDKQPFYDGTSPASEHAAEVQGDARTAKNLGAIKNAKNSCGCSK